MGINIIHPESALAHKYLDGLKGIEIGAASYQPFGLDTINVNTPDVSDRAHYNAVEEYLTGTIAKIDVYAEADDLPFDDYSQDFVIASHVLEHCCDPIKTLWEWDRVVKPGGYIFIIVPKRNAPYGDEERTISNIGHFKEALLKKWTHEQAFMFTVDFPSPEFRRWRGHYWVFDLKSLITLINEGALLYSWDVEEAHQTDDTDGTGHMVIFKKKRIVS